MTADPWKSGEHQTQHHYRSTANVLKTIELTFRKSATRIFCIYLMRRQSQVTRFLFYLRTTMPNADDPIIYAANYYALKQS
jgi:hypothetical protein